MSNVIIKGLYQTSDEKATIDTLNSMHSNMEAWIQPNVFVDRLTGKDIVDPEFVKRYGNPYNTIDKTNPVIEASLNDAEDRINKVKYYKESQIQEYKETTTLIKYSTEEYHDIGKVVCYTCSAECHPKTFHCWYCSQLLFDKRRK